MTATGKTLWSCLAHRDEVDRLVSGATPTPSEKKQATLFDLERD